MDARSEIIHDRFVVTTEILSMDKFSVLIKVTFGQEKFPPEFRKVKYIFAKMPGESVDVIDLPPS